VRNFYIWAGVLWLLIGFWLALLTYSIQSAMPHNPITLPGDDIINAKFFMPQGWKFFTRNPREDDTFIFQKDASGKWVDASIGTNGSPRNLFGLMRATRAQSIEMGRLLSFSKIDEFSKCKGRVEVCIENLKQEDVITNDSPFPTICGETAFVFQPPVPWAWSRAKKKVVMDSKIWKVGVLCQTS